MKIHKKFMSVYRIDPCSQFHQLYKQLLHRYSFAKKLQSQIVTREKLQKTLLYKKGVHKMLMKLTPGAGAIAFEFDT